MMPLSTPRRSGFPKTRAPSFGRSRPPSGVRMALLNASDHLRESRRSRFHDLAGQGIGVDHHRAEFTQARGRH